MYLIRLVIELYAPDEVLKQAGLTYYSMERTISLKFIPFPGLKIHIKGVVDENNKERFSKLFKSITHKTGIFEVERCHVYIDSERKYDLEAQLTGKAESTLDNYLGLKEFLEFYGFKEVKYT